MGIKNDTNGRMMCVNGVIPYVNQFAIWIKARLSAFRC
jgi:hypothetical protein